MYQNIAHLANYQKRTTYNTHVYKHFEQALSGSISLSNRKARPFNYYHINNAATTLQLYMERESTAGGCQPV